MKNFLKFTKVLNKTINLDKTWSLTLIDQTTYYNLLS